jgi:hypothetical protein
MKDIIEIIDTYLFDDIKEEIVNEELNIYVEPDLDEPYQTLKLQFTKKNVQKVANDYDAKLVNFDKDLQSAMLKDTLGRRIFVDGFKKRK